MKRKHSLQLSFTLPVKCSILNYVANNFLPEDGDVFVGTPAGRAILLGGLSPLTLPGVLKAPCLSMVERDPAWSRWGTRPSPPTHKVPMWWKGAGKPPERTLELGLGWYKYIICNIFPILNIEQMLQHLQAFNLKRQCMQAATGVEATLLFDKVERLLKVIWHAAL